MVLSVVFTTYNEPEWLEKVLWGYQCQTFKDFEVLIADDGSAQATRQRIAAMQEKVSFPIRHIWHEDRGFRKCTILNKAIQCAAADYLVFSDGDCIPRKDFLQAHLHSRSGGAFLSGGAVRLPMALSCAVSREDIVSQRVFDKRWLKSRGFRQNLVKQLKLTRNTRLGVLLNHLTPTKATWNGGNASAWKKDVLAVNGFNESMRYGAEDREFGTRLENAGLRSVQIRYSAVCLHLDHSRGYRNPQDLENNQRVWKQTRRNKTVHTPYGIVK